MKIKQTLTKQYYDIANKGCQNVGKVGYITLVKETPYDTRRAKRSWVINQRGKTRIFSDLDRRRSGTINVTENVAKVNRFDARKDKEISITSGLPYMRRLESGWSKQNRGFIRKTANTLVSKFNNRDLN